MTCFSNYSASSKLLYIPVCVILDSPQSAGGLKETASHCAAVPGMDTTPPTTDVNCTQRPTAGASPIVTGIAEDEATIYLEGNT